MLTFAHKNPFELVDATGIPTVFGRVASLNKPISERGEIDSSKFRSAAAGGRLATDTRVVRECVRDEQTDDRRTSSSSSSSSSCLFRLPFSKSFLLSNHVLSCSFVECARRKGVCVDDDCAVIILFVSSIRVLCNAVAVVSKVQL